MDTPPRTVRIQGRILYVTEDTALLEKQLAGEDLAFDPERPLVSNISTDELTPGWVCYYYDETLARYCLVGLRGGKVAKDAIKSGGFGVIVSGISKGCGSSRETAPYSELKAGVQLVIAKSIEKIYRQNAQNIGLFTSTDFGLIERIQTGEAIPVSEFTKGLDPISAAIVEHGGLFAYNRARLAGETSPPPITTPARPMTLCEKILAAHVITDARAGTTGVAAVKPGDAFFARTDVRFSHEYVTPMAESLFVAEMGKDATVTDPASVWAFRDHLTFLDLVMPKAHRDMGLKEQAASLATSLPAVAATGLPTSFLGEAAAVALAFAFPALVAGAWIGMTALARRIGLRGAMVIGIIGIVACFGWAILDARPDLITRLARI